MQYGTAIIKGTFDSIVAVLKEFTPQLSSSSCVFVFCRTEYAQNGDVLHDFLDVIQLGLDANLTYINTIVAPTDGIIHSELPDNVLYIVWFAKNRDLMCFNKDAIRESHIWKDVEWGHRAKNYNPRGKDPGNVWIPTEDDGKGNITKHILLDYEALIKRIDDCTKHNNSSSVFISDVEGDASLCPSNMCFEYRAPNYSSVTVISPALRLHNRSNRTKNNLFGEVIWGTSENMGTLRDGCIDVVITSPPYWDLKDYYKEGQIGQESYRAYLDRLMTVWRECYNKLADHGSFWLNINIRVKNNRVILIPRDFVQQCREIGFHYKGILIWHKSSGIPTHDKNIVDRHEYVLVFSKNEHLSLSEAIASYADYKNPKMNGGLLWNINRKAGSVGKKYIHPAIYPNELVARIVECSTVEGETVLDPFLGSGTTLIASILEHRNCYGYEYNEGFKDLILDRIQTDIGLLTNFKLII